MTTTPAIEGIGISKRFRIPRAQYSTLKGRMVHPFTRTRHDEFIALNDVSFAVEPGEFFGIVGRNGSGKSTLLKMIAGIYRADSGMLRINGAIAPFIELGVGFNEELSGRENLFLNGALLGMDRAQLQKRYDDIVEFAELEEFMELKLRNFSSGMQVRLAFSIALQAGADILLTDEVLAVGDERFQRKCFDVFRAQKQRGQTVVFVSHDMTAISRFCDRGMLLEKGRVRAYGPIHEVVREYHRLNQDADSGEVAEGGAEVLDVWIENADGAPVESVEVGDEAIVAIRFRVDSALKDVIVGIGIRDPYGVKLLGSNTELGGAPVPAMEPGQDCVARCRIPLHMARGTYSVAANIAWPTPGDLLTWTPDACELVVRGGGEQAGVIEMPHRWTFDASASPRPHSTQEPAEA